jgi:hypothetical protein
MVLVPSAPKPTGPRPRIRGRSLSLPAHRMRRPLHAQGGGLSRLPVAAGNAMGWPGCSGDQSLTADCIREIG